MVPQGSFFVLELATDSAWLRSPSFMTHLLVIAVFYLLWRLPGHSSSTSQQSPEVWYDCRQTADESCVESNDGNDDPPLSSADDAWLQAHVPESTSAERWRFFHAKGRKRQAAAASLRTYTDWRLQHAEVCVEAPPTNDQDLRAWNEASLIALKLLKEKQRSTPLPKVAHLHRKDEDYLRDGTGHRLLHFLPGRMDDRLASTVTYALAVALYVDRLLDRNEAEQVTVIIDLRGGHGWRNLNAAQLLPFIQNLSKLMLTMFPQRLYRACVFPIPPRFYWVWRIANRCLDERTRAKICPLEGPSTIDSPAPLQAMAEHVGRDNAIFMENFRKAGFLTAQ